MRIIIRVTVERNNQQQNTASIRNTEGEYFPHFGIIEANPFEGFGAFGENNNNNNLPSGNNNNNNLLPSLGFEEGFEGELERDFNLPPRENAEGLDSNIVALVNALTEVNLKINHTKGEINHIKLTEFKGMEVKDSNEQLEQYNRIAEANKWSEH